MAEKIAFPIQGETPVHTLCMRTPRRRPSRRALTQEQRMNPTVFIKNIHTEEEEKKDFRDSVSRPSLCLAVAGDTQ